MYGGNFPFNGFWNDEKGSQSTVPMAGYIVEYDVLPEPAYACSLVCCLALLARRRS